MSAQRITWSLALVGALLAGGAIAFTSAQTPGEAAKRSPHGGRLALSRVKTGNPPSTDIVTMSAGGRRRRPVIGDSLDSSVRPGFDRLAWLPNGRRIVFTAVFGGRGFRTDLYSVRTDGSDLRRLTDDRASAEPVVSPTGETVAFARFSWRLHHLRRSSSSLWLMDADGSNRRRLTPNRPGRFDLPGSFSPAGSLLAFTRRDGFFGASASIRTIKLNGSVRRKLARRGFDPAYSPEGDQIVFASDRDHNGRLCYGDRCFRAAELYLMNANGRGKERLSHTKKNEVAPAWSSDGARIAYQRGQVTGNAQASGVFATNPDGSCPTPIAFDPSLDTWFAAPAWKPGGAPGLLSC